MAKYIINSHAQPTGEHEVHREDICTRLPLAVHRISLGYFATCQEAIIDARNKWPNKNIDGCAYCSPTCNTR